MQVCGLRISATFWIWKYGYRFNTDVYDMSNHFNTIMNPAGYHGNRSSELAPVSALYAMPARCFARTMISAITSRYLSNVSSTTVMVGI
jgi:hypothetical protein